MPMPLFRSARVLGRLCLLASVAAFGMPWVWAAPPGKAIADEEIAAFGAAMEEATAVGDTAAMNALIDWEAVVDVVVADVEAPEKLRVAFRNGLLRVLKSGDPNGFAGSVAAESKKGATYRAIRQRTRNKRKTSLFRLTTPEAAGVNYHEFLLGRDRAGKVRASDVYIYLTGEMLSDTMRQSYKMVVAEETRGFAARLFGPDPKVLDSIAKISDVTRLLREDKPREAMALIDAMPAAVAETKTLMIGRVRAAQAIDDAMYAGAIERYRQLFPDDPSTILLSIDGFVLLKDYAKALSAVDRLEKSVGGDPYLGALRSNLLLLVGRPTDARKTAEAAVAGCPDVIDPHWSLLGTTLRQDDHPATLATLKLIDRRFDLDFGDLAGDPEYAKFVASPQHAEWKTYLAGKAAPAPRPEQP